ncbi:MAG: hypothetical protein V1869_00450 [Candidatus Omnitrophota bacterium]
MPYGIIMNDDIERDLGLQPLEAIMVERGFKAADLVKNSSEQLTFKMVSRAIKGRRLRPNAKQKVLRALNTAAGKQYEMGDLFTY